MKIQATVVVTLVLAATTAMAQQAPNWQLNAPYVCRDGNSYTITKRAGAGNGQMCWWTQRHKGQFDAHVVSLCFALVGRLRGCKVGVRARARPPGPKVAPADIGALDDTRYSCPGGFTTTVFQCGRRGAHRFCWTKLELHGEFIAGLPKPVSAITKLLKSCQRLPPLDPAYLDEFPGGLRVAQAMMIGNPLDNAQRAIGAYYQLGVIVRTLAAGRGLTPQERTLLGEYGRMRSQLQQAAARKFPGQHFDLASNPYHFGRTDPKFGFAGIPVWTALLSPSLQSRFARIVGANDWRYMAAVRQQRQAALHQVETDRQIVASQAGMVHNPGVAAVRHCMESGRSETECVGEGVKTAAIAFFGGNPATALAPPFAPGLRLTGMYGAGNFRLVFSQSIVKVRCGSLMAQGHPYSVQRSGLHVLVTVAMRPKPLRLAYRANGQLVGPGAITVSGRVVTGPAVAGTSTEYQAQTQTTMTRRSIGALDVPNYSADQVHQNGMDYSVDQPTTTTTTVPVQVPHYTIPTAPKTERCSVGTLPPTGRTMTIMGALARGFGMHAGRSTNSAPGLRLGGSYKAPGGLRIVFRGDSATLQCGRSLKSEGYAVVPRDGTLVVKFDNNTGPFSLVMQPNGTLTGGGTVVVAGRTLYRTAAGQDAYAPLNSRCVVGTLAAGR